jgi:hypothetical protein
MAFKIWDGFDHYNSLSDLLARSGFLQWQTPSGLQPSISFVSGLVPGKPGSAIKILNNNGATTPNETLRAVWGARNAEAYFGQRVLIPGGVTGPASHLYVILQDTVAGSPQITILFNGSNYSVQVFQGAYNGGVTLALSANNVWTGDTQQFVEIHAKIDGSVGEVDVRVRGNSVFGGPVTGLNTKSTANAWFDAVDYGPAAVSANVAGFVEIDDLYYADTTTGSGSFAANTFAGDCRVATLFATGNQSVQWTPLAGSNWQEVSETAMDGDTSYNATATAGQEDLLAFGALSGIGLIYGIQLTGAYRKDDAGARIVKQAVKSGATEVYGSNWSLADTYTYFTDQWILDPNTSANWTVGAVNAGYYGYNLVS